MCNHSVVEPCRRLHCISNSFVGAGPMVTGDMSIPGYRMESARVARRMSFYVLVLSHAPGA
jgi:hypothetical protein